MKTISITQPAHVPYGAEHTLQRLPSHLSTLGEAAVATERQIVPVRFRPPEPASGSLADSASTHVSPDPVGPMTTKVCVKCKQAKPLLEFHKNSRSADGLHSYCKECNRAQALAHIKAEKARKALLRAAKKAAATSK